MEQPLSRSTNKGMGAYGIPDGTITEPTNDVLVAFFTAIGDLRTLGTTPAEGEDATATGLEVLAKVQQATADLCSGNPSAEQFAALPPRLFREFVKWLAGEFTDPKG